MDKADIELGTMTMHNLDTRKLGAAFFAEDDIGVMLRSHFLVEQASIHALETLTGGRWKKLNTKMFGEKIALLEVLGAPPRLLVPARTLNNQRNQFAHEGEETITELKMLDVLRSLRSFVPQFTDDFHIKFRGGRRFDGKFADCSISQKYVLTAAMLAAFIGVIPQMMKTYVEKRQFGPALS